MPCGCGRFLIEVGPQSMQVDGQFPGCAEAGWPLAQESREENVLPAAALLATPDPLHCPPTPGRG